MAKKCVLPLSGGLDSTVIAHMAASEGYEIHAISYDYGQRHYRKELRCARDQAETIAKTHKLIDARFIRELASTSSLTNDNIPVAKTKDVLGDPQTVNYVPNRNMMMLSMCTAYAETVGADVVFHGAALVDSQAGFWDGSNEFIHAINNVNQLNRRNVIEIIAPLILKSKADIIKTGIDLGVDFSKTWTCYEGNEQACGECTACSSRIKGFIDAGIKDPLPYAKEIPWDKLIKHK